VRFADLVVAIVLAVLFAAVFGAFFDLAPLLAKAMVRRAALWWHSDLDSPEALAEEWQALVEERPVGTLKVVTGLGFLARATVRHGQFVTQPLRERSARLLRKWIDSGRHVLDRASGLLRNETRRGVYVRNFPAIGLFLLGAVLGQWVIMLVAVLIACCSRFYTRVEKWALVVAVPVSTATVYTIGFWLNRQGALGGHKASSADLLAGALSFFGTMPRIASLLAALFLTWRLAHGIARMTASGGD
jgi:hypothetical protein